MASKQPHREVPEEHRAAEHLANERTFLAWVRTSIALISLGFVLARLTPGLPDADGATAHRLAVKALPLDVGMGAFGALLTVLAGWRYHLVNRAIESSRVKDDRALVWFVTALIVVLSAALVGFMLLANG